MIKCAFAVFYRLDIAHARIGFRQIHTDRRAEESFSIACLIVIPLTQRFYYFARGGPKPPRTDDFPPLISAAAGHCFADGAHSRFLMYDDAPTL